MIRAIGLCAILAFPMSALAAERLTLDAFREDVKSELGEEAVFGGNLSIGGDCRVEIVESKHPFTDEPRLTVQISVEARPYVKFVVDAKETVKMSLETIEDGSYQKIYSTKFGTKLIRTHEDDAGDSWAIDAHDTRLTCSIDI